MKYAGVDWSLNGPAICKFDSEIPITWESVDIYYLTPIKKYVIDNNTLHGTLLEEQKDVFARWDYLTAFAMNHMYDIVMVVFEAYSYGSKGRAIFNIAESTGIVKQNIWESGINIELEPPKTIKKFYTGSGNANKQDMYTTFYNETGVNLREVFDYTKKDIQSPISDIVDSWAIAKYVEANYEY